VVRCDTRANFSTPGRRPRGTSEASPISTRRNIYSDASAYNPTTVVSYQFLVGPGDQFTALMRTVYLPIIFQFMSSDSSTIKPTPSPTLGF
jgi:hypothetical protein